MLTGKQKEIRFHAGDVVEWFGLDAKKARLGIVTSVPPTPERCHEIEERIKKDESKQCHCCLDYPDDCYTIINKPDFIASHEHVFAPLVSRPSFYVPGKLRRQLEKAWQKVKNENQEALDTAFKKGSLPENG